jgi:PAS domain S-box-containing protein
MNKDNDIFQIIFDASSELNCVFDLQGKLLLVNKTACNLIGYEPLEIIGTDFLIEVSKLLLNKKSNSKLIDKDSTVNLVAKNGQKSNWKFSFQKISYQNKKCFYAIGKNITQQIESEKESEIADKLYDLNLNRLHKTLLDLQKAKSLSEETVKAKQQFLANVSHEIRTPMNAIIGFSNVLLKSKLNKQELQYVNAIKKSGDSLMNIINEILDLSKLESGNFSFDESKFNLYELIDSVKMLFELVVQDKELSFNINFKDKVTANLIGDAGRLHQILVNLVGNSIKFTEKGFVKIDIEEINKINELVHLRFSVIDSGIGIEEKNLEKVFESFTQASNATTRKYGGTGLGLTICKQLVELQGGKIYVHSEFGKGTNFTFEVPFKTFTSDVNKDKETIEKYYVKNENLSQYKILVVEDNEINTLLTSKILEDWGFKFSVANSGKKAISILDHDNFDLILMDIQMPEMDGYEATQIIRNSNKRHKNIPIIATTAHAANDEIERALSVGMNDCVTKPFPQQVLLQKILKYIYKHRSNEVTGIINKNNKLINLSYLQRVAAGDDKFIVKMINIFINQYPEIIVSIKEDLNNNNWSGFRSKIHKLMPSISFMGITALSAELKQIDETKNEPPNLQSYIWIIEHLESITNQASIELKEYLQQLQLSV